MEEKEGSARNGNVAKMYAKPGTGGMDDAHDCSNARTENSGWVMMRVVSLVPSITEALCMLGLQDSIVGVADYCTAPAEAVRGKERVGGTKNPRVARVLELRPDLVIVNTDENRK